MVNENDEEWQRRVVHRRNGVNHVLNSPAYITLAGLGVRVVGPDPEDRSLSKRAWEKEMQLWVRAIKPLID
jgi:hypothetical protein